VLPFKVSRTSSLEAGLVGRARPARYGIDNHPFLKPSAFGRLHVLPRKTDTMEPRETLPVG
jgi:hypothetical protein